MCVCVCVFIPELLQEPKAAAPPETHTLWPHSFRGANRVKRTVTSPDAPCGDHVKLEWGIPGFSPSRSDRSALPLPKTAREKHEWLAGMTRTSKFSKVSALVHFPEQA